MSMTHHLLEALISQPCFFFASERVIAKQGRRNRGAGGVIAPPPLQDFGGSVIPYLN